MGYPVGARVDYVQFVLLLRSIEHGVSARVRVIRVRVRVRVRARVTVRVRVRVACASARVSSRK